MVDKRITLQYISKFVCEREDLILSYVGLCILPDVQINLGVEIHEHDCRYKSEDDALTPVNVGHVHSVDPHFRHVEPRTSHIRPSLVLKECARYFLSVTREKYLFRTIFGQS